MNTTRRVTCLVLSMIILLCLVTSVRAEENENSNIDEDNKIITVTTQDEFKNAFTTINGKKDKENWTIKINSAGNYSFPSESLPTNITIAGIEDNNKSVVFDYTSSSGQIKQTYGLTLKNIYIKFGTSNYTGFQHADPILMDNCVIDGYFASYGDMTFENCTFNATDGQYSMWVYGPGTNKIVKYISCTFNSYGKILNIYREGSEPNNVYIENCTFNSTKSNKAALNVKSIAKTSPYTYLNYNVYIDSASKAEALFPAASFPKDNGDNKNLDLYIIAPIVQVDDIDKSDINFEKNGIYVYMENKNGTYSNGLENDNRTYKRVYPYTNPVEIFIKDTESEDNVYTVTLEPDTSIDLTTYISPDNSVGTWFIAEPGENITVESGDDELKITAGSTAGETTIKLQSNYLESVSASIHVTVKAKETTPSDNNGDDNGGDNNEENNNDTSGNTDNSNNNNNSGGGSVNVPVDNNNESGNNSNSDNSNGGGNGDSNNNPSELEHEINEVVNNVVENMSTEEKENITNINEVLTEEQKTTINDNQLQAIVNELDNLETLDLAGNQNITNVDLSGKENLTSVNLENCDNLHALDVSGCSSLVEVEGISSNTSITNLNASGCENLQTLDVSGCEKLEILDISGCSSLTELEGLNNTSITKLDASGCENLETLDVSGCENLETLDCSDSALSDLNVEGCSSLQELNCSNNNLGDLSVANCEVLETLDCSKNSIANLTVQGCLNLKRLYCYSNNLEKLELPVQRLEWLVCDNNKLQELNVEENRRLQRLDCQNNGMGALEIDRSVFEDLNWLKCYGQRIPDLNIIRNGNNYQVRINDYIRSYSPRFASAGAIVSEVNVINVIDVKGFDKNGNEIEKISYDASTGVVEFAESPAKVSYGYKTGYNDIVMDVTLGEETRERNSNASDDDNKDNNTAYYGGGSSGCNMGISVIALAACAIFLKKAGK